MFASVGVCWISRLLCLHNYLRGLRVLALVVVLYPQLHAFLPILFCHGHNDNLMRHALGKDTVLFLPTRTLGMPTPRKR
jgi:hypothetical protein